MNIDKILITILFLLCSVQGIRAQEVVQQPDDDEEEEETYAPLQSRMSWGKRTYRGNSWVTNASLPYTITEGLQGRHLSINASHGIVFDQKKYFWKWQRPALWMTREDIFTMSFVVPYLMPMLENAGACVWTARERCWMPEEVIIDNDSIRNEGLYTELVGTNEWQTFDKGFAWKKLIYYEGDNPFTDGTARIVDAQKSRRMPSLAMYKPILPKDGSYAVYVSYPKLATNVPDAQYVVRHRGIETTVRVNQQMGGGTWVYIGTFDFAAGDPQNNCVTLSNVSNYRGTVATDAVRFGGGMGNIARTDSFGTVKPTLSGLPRYMEGARYSMQWAGMPRHVYSEKQGSWDYGDDILTRGMATNYVGGGSCYMPGDSGLSVPIEFCLAVHSDAGYTTDGTLCGSLALMTSNTGDGYYPSRMSRMAVAPLTEMMLDEISREMQQHFGQWATRGVWDKNYGETRVPQIPATIIEMFSHQNFYDIRLGHDPNVKFHLMRALYKSILRYTALLHQDDRDATVQPLPVRAFSAVAEPRNSRIVLSWQPTIDPLEPSAKPREYVIYTKRGEGGWDNGRVTDDTTYHLDAEEDVLYQFRVCALNEGGISMPSEELCARISSSRKSPSALIVNGFQRLAAPYSFETDSTCGFRMDIDPGVAYMATPEYCGKQTSFDKAQIGKEVDNGLGVSTDEYLGILMKGNTFDYPTLHARDIITYNAPIHISSCSREAVETGSVKANMFAMLDLILGAQRSDGYSPTDYKTFTPRLKDILRSFTDNGGALLCTGAYVGTDMTDADDRHFTRDVLHLEAGDSVFADSLLNISGTELKASMLTVPNNDHLHTRYVSELRPEGTAFPNLLYTDSGRAASVAYKGHDYRCITMGFPIEQLQETAVRRKLMHGYLNFLLDL